MQKDCLSASFSSFWPTQNLLFSLSLFFCFLFVFETPESVSGRDKIFSVAISFNTEYYEHDNWKRVAIWSCLLSISLSGHTLSNDLGPIRRSQLHPTVKTEEKKKSILVKLKLCTMVQIHGLSCKLGTVFEGVFPREIFDAFPGVTECLMFIYFNDLRERDNKNKCDCLLYWDCSRETLTHLCPPPMFRTRCFVSLSQLYVILASCWQEPPFSWPSADLNLVILASYWQEPPFSWPSADLNLVILASYWQEPPFSWPSADLNLVILASCWQEPPFSWPSADLNLVILASCWQEPPFSWPSADLNLVILASCWQEPPFSWPSADLNLVILASCWQEPPFSWPSADLNLVILASCWQEPPFSWPSADLNLVILASCWQEPPFSWPSADLNLVILASCWQEPIKRDVLCKETVVAVFSRLLFGEDRHLQELEGLLCRYFSVKKKRGKKRRGGGGVH